MASIDLELIVLVFFWIGLWGMINTVLSWLFEQIGSYHNFGTVFLIYLILFLFGLYVINVLINNGLDIDSDVQDDDNNR